VSAPALIPSWSFQRRWTKKRDSEKKRWSLFTKYGWHDESKQRTEKHDGRHDERRAPEETSRHSQISVEGPRRPQTSPYHRCSSLSTRPETEAANDAYLP
jgi:hypothetical protein